jgi:protein-tyrosine phosphatase
MTREPQMKEASVLFVCMGNICRSPTAEGVFRDLVMHAGLDRAIHIDSAGTHAYHIGKSPDPRASAAAAQRGYDLSTLRGRQVSEQDFLIFDYILAMDEDNLSNLKRICPAGHEHKVSLFLEHSQKFSEREVPDPYYGGKQGFEQVLDMVEDAAQGLLDKLVAAHSLRP